MPFLSRLKPNINPLFGGIGGQNPYSVTVRLSLSILATFPIGAQDTNMSFLSLLSYQVQGPSGSCPFFGSKFITTLLLEYDDTKEEFDDDI